MFPSMIDLSQFEKKVRSKIKLAIFTNYFLHLIYIVIKNYRTNPDELSRYQSFWQLINDVSFIKRAFIKEGRSDKLKQNPYLYFKLAETLKNRGYSGLLELIETVWDLTVHHKKIDSKLFFNAIIGLNPSIPSIDDHLTFLGKVSYTSKPFIIKLMLYNFLIVETEFGSGSEKLAKTLLYLGSLEETDRSLGMFARFSIRSIDAEELLRTQEKGYAHRLHTTYIFYPTVLRMQRHPYKKVKSIKELDSEVSNMISELYVEENTLSQIVDRDAPANILAMAPSISLRGGLCIPTAFRGELLDTLGSSKGARIKVGDITIKAYPSFFSTLPHYMYPGDYIFVMLHPFPLPRIGITVATYPVDKFDKVKPKKRNVSFLDKYFPKIQDITRASI